jgi:uncharacterized SAM-binding protein YcdF (DUF218 family)
MKTARAIARGLTRLFAALGLLAVLVITTPLVEWWAHAYAGSIDQPRGDILILLSAAGDDQGTISYSSYWRARMALIAWQTGSYRKIVISGGGGPGILNFLAASGIPPQAMVAEWESRSTRENGINTARLIRDMPGTKVLLTSDFHMYRAQRVFRKLGVEVIPYAAPDALHQTQVWYGRIPAFQNLLLETVKIVDYRLRGWI